MQEALSLLTNAITEAEYLFNLLFLRVGAFIPYIAGLTVLFAVRFLLMPIVGSFNMSSDKAKKPKKGQ